MTQTTTPEGQTGTVRVNRMIKAPRERVFNAFLDADAFAKWIPPHGYTGHIYQWKGEEGGRYRMSFSSLDKSDAHSFGGTFLEIKPFERIRYTNQFETDHPDMQGELKVTVTFMEVRGGTEIQVLQEGIPKIIPVADATKGWGQSMENLARLVEL